MFYLQDGTRFREPTTNKATTILGLLLGPSVSPTFMVAFDLQRYVRARRITDPAQLMAEVRRKRGDPRPVLTLADARFLLKWLALNDDPSAWAAEFRKQKIPKPRSKTGLRATGGSEGTEPQPEVGGELFNIAKNLFFWLETAAPMFPELDIAIGALNKVAPAWTTFIIDQTAGLLSPLGIFPFSEIVFRGLGQIVAAYPFITFVVYVNLSRGNTVEALKMAVMYLLFVGPMLHTLIKVAEGIYGDVLHRWQDILNLPERIMVPIRGLYGTADRLLGALLRTTQSVSSVLARNGDVGQATTVALQNAKAELKTQSPSETSNAADGSAANPGTVRS